MENVLNEFKEGHELSVIKDPFLKDSVVSIAMNLSTNSFNDTKYWWGNVCFKNGTTEGKVSATSCNSFEELLTQIKQILNSVKDKEE